VIGSNIFNILAVVGITGLLAPEGVPVSSEVLHFDIPIMVMVALACAPVFLSGLTIQRWEGFLLLAYYLAYLAHLVLSAAGNPTTADFDAIVLSLMIPLTALAVLVFHNQTSASKH